MPRLSLPRLLLVTTSLPFSPCCPTAHSPSTDHSLMCGNLSWGTAQQSKAENITHLESNAEGKVDREDATFRACPHLLPTPSSSSARVGTAIPHPRARRDIPG